MLYKALQTVLTLKSEKAEHGAGRLWNISSDYFNFLREIGCKDIIWEGSRIGRFEEKGDSIKHEGKWDKC